MSNESESDDGLDDILAPLVDGLSGTVAVILLVTVVFIIFSLGQVMAVFQAQQFPRSNVNLEENIISFRGSLDISYTDLALIKNDIAKERNGKKLKFYSFVAKSSEKSTDKAIVAIIKLRNALNLIDVAIATGNENECAKVKKNHYDGCLYWSFE